MHYFGSILFHHVAIKDPIVVSSIWFTTLINFIFIGVIILASAYTYSPSSCLNSWDRNDAGLAAAELALAVEKHVLESGSIDTVGTVGKPFSLHEWYICL